METKELPQKYAAAPKTLNRLVFYRNDRDFLSVSSISVVTNDTISSREQSIIFASAYIDTRMDVCSALSVKNISGCNKLSVSPLRSEALRLGIAAVLCGADTLFMSHYEFLLAVMR